MATDYASIVRRSTTSSSTKPSTGLSTKPTTSSTTKPTTSSSTKPPTGLSTNPTTSLSTKPSSSLSAKSTASSSTKPSTYLSNKELEIDESDNPGFFTIDPKTGIYARYSHTPQQQLSTAMAYQYGVPHCNLFCSGINAIYVILDSLATSIHKGKFLISKHLYCEVNSKVIKQLKIRHRNIRFVIADIYNTDRSVFDNIDVLYIESCSNPDGFILNPEIIKSLSAKTYVVVDNTWLSPVAHNPFDHGAHIVVESLTKYVSGSTCIMGAAYFKYADEPIMQLCVDYNKATGLHIDPAHCTFLLKRLTSLEQRIMDANHRTRQYLFELQQHHNIDKIHHPLLIYNPKDPEMSILKIKSSRLIIPNVIYFHIKPQHNTQWKSTFKEHIKSACEYADILYQTSFGHLEDSIDMWPKKDEDGIWVRLAVGYSDNHTIINQKIERFLQYM